MKRTSLERRTPLARHTPLARATELARTTQLARGSTSSLRRTPLGHATPAQRARVKDRQCIVFDPTDGLCRCHGPVQPAHLIDRALAPAAGDHPLAVVPLCARHHELYDDHDLDLSPYLEPAWRDSVAWAVEAVGLFMALRRITGKRWVAVEEVVEADEEKPNTTTDGVPVEAERA
jgi:hypothetical protein